jgi:ribulose-5-phosphate 4-epimerase/fuculose-1-phosphate aldolase
VTSTVTPRTAGANDSDRPEPVIGGYGKTLYFDLAPEAEVALLARMLHREGYDDHTWGHITYAQEDGTFLMSAWEVPWGDMKASDIVHCDAGGNFLDGRWSVTPAISLHLATHRLRPDIRVAVHHHSQYGSVWAAVSEVPEDYLQSNAGIAGELVLYDEYQGDVTFAEIAERNVLAMGENVAAVLANHGVFVVGDTIERAHQRAVNLEQRCQLAWRVKAMGETKGKPLEPDVKQKLVRSITNGRAGHRYYHAMIRREVMADPSVLM